MKIKDKTLLQWLLTPSPIGRDNSTSGDEGADVQSKNFLSGLDDIDGACREWWRIMLEEDCPKAAAAIGVPGVLGVSDSMRLSETLLQAGVKRGSPLWYCARILDFVAVARATIKRGDIEATANVVLALGYYWGIHSTMTMHYEAIKIGAKLAPTFESGRTIANAGRQAAASQEHRRWVAAAREAWKRNQRLSVSACARTVIKRLELKAGLKTVSDVIRSHKKVGEAR